MLKQPVDTEIAQALTDQSEGWVTSLRLAGLYARQRQGVFSWAEVGAGSRRNLEDYFASEVLARLSPQIYTFLVYTSVLDFLNGSLCDFVLTGSGEAGDSAALLRQLEEEGVFMTSLDGDTEWRRCHLLFRQVLQMQLNERATDEEIRTLYERASSWYEQRGLLDEALHYALGDKQEITYAVAFMRRYRSSLLDKLELRQLDHWLRLFPPAAIPMHVDLLLAQSWIAQFRYEMFDLRDCLQQIYALLASRSPDSPEIRVAGRDSCPEQPLVGLLWGV